DSGPADSGSAVPLPGAAGDLVISEILYDPEAMTPEGDFEWIEIHNPGTVARELAGCTIADASASGMHLIAPATGSLVIAAGDYVVLARSDTPGFTPDYSYAGEFTLNNTGAGDTVTLACGSAGTLIDQVAYSPDGGWVDPVGASLSLDPSRLDHLMNDSPASWCAATTAFATGDLGTPGMPNPACTTP
ncbi:MAG: lamin tail domain-containing protein, partial [Deltaproteobacteria bacterium]|nr:lamin tail domain-containing protein [Deltaproteobacteria bacterium]